MPPRDHFFSGANNSHDNDDRCDDDYELSSGNSRKALAHEPAFLCFVITWEWREVGKWENFPTCFCCYYVRGCCLCDAACRWRVRFSVVDIFFPLLHAASGRQGEGEGNGPVFRLEAGSRNCCAFILAPGNGNIGPVGGGGIRFSWP